MNSQRKRKPFRIAEGKKSLLRKTFLWTAITAAFFLLCFSPAQAADENVCVAYLTGIGCHNCAIADPVLFTQLTQEFPHLVILDYEIFSSRKENFDVKNAYFKVYSPGEKGGVPFVIFNKDVHAMGRNQVVKIDEDIRRLKVNPCPMPEGTAVDLSEMDIASLPGKINIWTKNRVLMRGLKGWGRSEVLRRVIQEPDLDKALEGFSFKKTDPIPVPISGGELTFTHAILLDDWRLQWNGGPLSSAYQKQVKPQNLFFGMILVLIVLGAALSSFRVTKVSKGAPLKFEWKRRKRDVVIAVVAFFSLVAFFWLAKNISSDFLEQAGYKLPLPVFTFLIALVDGFNPCNMFVLTCLLALLIATSVSKSRLYAVAVTFVGVVYVFYYLFMAAWLNVFKYISFITPLRIALGSLAIAAGVINCKDLFFFKKGISLTIQDKHKGPLMKRMDKMKEVIQRGSFPLLISSSIGLATLASLVELPCTAGFPIVYTGILSGRGLESTAAYYLYLAFYNFVYVVPLLVIVFVFINTFRARQITQRQMEIIKFIGGAIMLLLGIVLLVNPGLLGIGIK